MFYKIFKLNFTENIKFKNNLTYLKWLKNSIIYFIGKISKYISYNNK